MRAEILPPFLFERFVYGSVKDLSSRINPLPAQNLYEVLGIKNDCSVEEITRAYREQALYWHPDKHMNSTTQQRKIINERFNIINYAGNMLRYPETRCENDLHIDRYPDQSQSPPVGMTYQDALRLFVCLFIDTMKTKFRDDPKMNIVAFTASLSLPMLFGAYGGETAAKLGLAFGFLIRSEEKNDPFNGLTIEQCLALSHVARVLLERH